MNLKLSLSIIFLLIFFSISAQNNFITISGCVKSSVDSLPVHLANITIKDQAIGTFTNEAGEFVFHIPDTLLNEEFIISSIGYYNFKCKVSDIKQKRVFLLEPHDYHLNEVTVLPDTMNPKYIVKKAIQNIYRNYPRKRFYMDAFYRGIAYSDTGYLRLVEAAIGIFDFGYSSNAEKVRLKVLELRKSEDYVSYSKYKPIFKLLYGNENILYDTYFSNPFLKQTKYISLNNSFRKEFNFKLLDITYLNDELVYLISFIKTRFGGNDGVEGLLYIGVENYAFIKVISGWFTNFPVGNKFRESLYKDKYWYQNIITFKKYQGKYYPNYIERNSVLQDYEALGIFFRDILIINNIYIRKRQYEKISKKQAEKKDIVLYEQDFEYHPDFWKNYNILLTNPIQQKVKKDLEKEKKLETQFQENSK